MGVAWTDQRAIGQYDWRRQVGNVELRNGDGDLGGFNQKFNLSQVQRISGREAGFLDSLAADEGPVG
jgi:hypothetical protein